jgi:hypothetical protein
VDGGDVLTRYHAWCSIGPGRILFSGGEFSGVTTNKAWYIECGSWTAEPAPAMTSRRQDHFLVEFNGLVFAFGGDNGKQVYQTSERYDGTTWAPIADMLNKRHQLGGCRIGDQIYLAGAFSSKLEVYTPATDSYRELSTCELPNKKTCTAL